MQSSNKERLFHRKIWFHWVLYAIYNSIQYDTIHCMYMSFDAMMMYAMNVVVCLYIWINTLRHEKHKRFTDWYFCWEKEKKKKHIVKRMQENCFAISAIAFGNEKENRTETKRKSERKKRRKLHDSKKNIISSTRLNRI